MFTRLGVCGKIWWHLDSNPNSWLSSEPVMAPATRLGLSLTEAQFPPVIEAFYRRQDAQSLSPPDHVKLYPTAYAKSPRARAQTRLLDGPFSRLLRHAGSQQHTFSCLPVLQCYTTTRINSPKSLNFKMQYY